MKLYCESCGKQLKHTRKALPKLGIIVELVSYHECAEEPIPFYIDPSNALEAVPIKGKDKFVKSLNALAQPLVINQEGSTSRSLRPSSMTGTDDLRDRRFDHAQVPSSAPSSVLDQIKSMSNSIPLNDLKDDLTDSEMGG